MNIRHLSVGSPVSRVPKNYDEFGTRTDHLYSVRRYRGKNVPRARLHNHPIGPKRTRMLLRERSPLEAFRDAHRQGGGGGWGRAYMSSSTMGLLDSIFKAHDSTRHFA